MHKPYLMELYEIWKKYQQPKKEVHLTEAEKEIVNKIVTEINESKDGSVIIIDSLPQ